MPGGLITLDTYDSCQRTPRTVLLGVRRISSLILMARDLSIEQHLDGCYSLWALAYSLSQWMNYFNVCTSSHGFLLRRLDSIRCTRVSLTTDDCSWANRELEKLIRSPTKPAVIDMGNEPAMAGTWTRRRPVHMYVHNIDNADYSVWSLSHSALLLERNSFQNKYSAIIITSLCFTFLHTLFISSLKCLFINRI